MVVKATVQSADVSTPEVWRANSPQLRELRTESGVSLFDAAEKYPGSEGDGNPWLVGVSRNGGYPQELVCFMENRIWMMVGGLEY